MIILSMIARNEADRYLKRVLESARKWADLLVLLDDASTDNTSDIARSVFGKDAQIRTMAESAFAKEHILRAEQWRFATEIAQEDDSSWIATLDADEQFEDSFTKEKAEEVVAWADAQGIDQGLFRLYDMWNETHFRADRLWCAHERYCPFLVHYKSGMELMTFPAFNQHCGRFPTEVKHVPYALYTPRIQHLGWSRERDREAKYKRYMALDPEGLLGSLEQYKSILDPSPNLIAWKST